MLHIHSPATFTDQVYTLMQFSTSTEYYFVWLTSSLCIFQFFFSPIPGSSFTFSIALALWHFTIFPFIFAFYFWGKKCNSIWTSTPHTWNPMYAWNLYATTTITATNFIHTSNHPQKWTYNVEKKKKPTKSFSTTHEILKPSTQTAFLIVLFSTDRGCWFFI